METTKEVKTANNATNVDQPDISRETAQSSEEAEAEVEISSRRARRRVI